MKKLKFIFIQVKICENGQFSKISTQIKINFNFLSLNSKSQAHRGRVTKSGETPGFSSTPKGLPQYHIGTPTRAAYKGLTTTVNGHRFVMRNLYAALILVGVQMWYQGALRGGGRYGACGSGRQYGPAVGVSKGTYRSHENFEIFYLKYIFKFYIYALGQFIMGQYYSTTHKLKHKIKLDTEFQMLLTIF